MSNPVSPIIAEIKSLADKVIGQAVSFAAYYGVVAHTDFTKIETAVGAGLAALSGYIINRLRALNV